MILSFKEQFVEKIKQEHKTTTIRKSGRWKVGQKIHFWKGSPRNPKSNPYHFGMGVVERVEHIELWLGEGKKDHLMFLLNRNNQKGIYLGGKNRKMANEIAKNDGFENWDELREWFRNTYKKQIDERGNLFLEDLDLIHFTYEGL